MNEERQRRINFLRDQIHTFVRYKPNEGVNNFRLDGEDTGKKLEIIAFAALFPFATHDEMVLIYDARDDDPPAEEYYNRILQLSVDDRIRSKGVKNDDYFRLSLMEWGRVNHFPFAVLTFARNEDGRDVVSLSTIWGLAPEEALADFQNRAQEEPDGRL